MKYINLMLLLLSLVLTTNFSNSKAWAGAYDRFTSECGEINVKHEGKKITHDGTSGRYCIVRDSRSTSRDIIWNFHSYFGYERSWLVGKRARLINWGLMNKNYNYPTVITVSFGKRFYSHFLVTPKNKLSTSGLYEAFTKTLMPHLEQKAVGNFSGKRIGIGSSMGGYNLAQIAFRKPELFNKVVLISPLCHLLSPWSPSYTVERFIDDSNNPRMNEYYSSSPASSSKITIALEFLDNYYENVDDFNRNSLVNLLKNLSESANNEREHVQLPQVYLSTTKDDNYGLRPSAYKLRDALVKANFDVEFIDVKTNYKASTTKLKIRNGDAQHSMVNPYSLADFLTKN